MSLLPEQTSNSNEAKPPMPAVKARQGVISGRVILVLIVAVVLAVMGIAMAFWVS